MSSSTAASLTLKSPRSERTPDTAAARPARLTGQVVRVADLMADEREQMYALLSRYFAHTTREQFTRDLARKEWAVVLRDSVTRRVQGFSTLARFTLTAAEASDGKPVVVFFSGDTIIDRDYWGETALPRLWGQHVFRLADQVRDARVYWFLICSGYKTYRYLPLFFVDFYPRCERATPASIKALVDHLGWIMLGDEYDTRRGVIRFKHAAPLQPGVASITEQRMKNPHVAFFIDANPGHAEGDELACLAELSRDNLTAAGRRMVAE